MTEPSSSRKLRWLWLLPLLLIAVALAAPMLNADALFVDEYWSIRNSGGAYYGPLSPAEIWTTMAEVDPGGMGIAYQWLLAGWFALAGTSQFTLRLLSLFAGLLTLALLYRTGKQLFSHKIGLYAAVLLAFTAFFVDYMHEGRAYTLLTLAILGWLAAYTHILHAKRDPGIISYGLLALSVSFLIYLHYVAFFMAIALAAYHLLVFPKNRRWLLVTVATLIGGLSYLPWAAVALDVLRSGTNQTGRQATSMTAPELLETLFTAMGNGSPILALLLLLAVLWWMVKQRKNIRQNVLLLLIWLAGTIIVIIIANSAVPFMVHLRYLLLIFPAGALLMSIGLHTLSRSGIPAIAMLLLWMAAGLWQINNPAFINGMFGQIYRAPWPGLEQGIERIETQADSSGSDLVLLHSIPPGFEPFNYFVLPYWFHDIPVRFDQYEKMNNSFARNDNDYFDDVQQVIQDAPFIWTLRVPEVPTTNLFNVTQYALDTQYLHCGTLIERDDALVDAYASPVDREAVLEFETDAGTLDLFPVKSVYQTENSLQQMWAWRVDSPVDVAIALHVDDAAGNFVGQADLNLTGTGRSVGCHNFAIDISTLEPGDYTLLALVYNPQNGERLNATHLQTGEESTRPTLDTITLP